MTFFNVVELLGGLALFLYGMSVLGTGLEKLSGGRLEKTLEKLTNNIFTSVLLGALVTGAVQSSSATTVIVVGLVNARILKLRQAIGVIMGANIGTTITAHILRLSDISSDNFLLQLLKPTTLAPLVAIVGIVMFMGAKRTKKKDIGSIMIGFGILFTGMFTMEGAVSPLRDMPQISSLFETFSNPVIGVLVGAIVTAVIQSSSASVGILQALSSTGKITYSSAFPIIMGQNIGTCITPLLASIGASKNAKRTAMVHLYFNVIGTLVFLFATYAIQHFIGFPFWNDVIDKGGIANFHTVFNVVITSLFIPFAGVLEKLAIWTVRRQGAEEDEMPGATLNLDERFQVSPGLAIQQGKATVLEMAKNAKLNFGLAVSLFEKYDPKVVERLKEHEMVIDKMEDKLRSYLLALSERELTESDSRGVSQLLQLMGEFERIGDYAVNIYECADQVYESQTKFSPAAREELTAIADAVAEIIDLALNSFEQDNSKLAYTIEPLEQVIDVIEETLKVRHVERLKSGSCTIDAAFPFIDTLSHMERISDHCSNIGVNIIGHKLEFKDFDRHEYLAKIHRGDSGDYAEQYRVYNEKYYSRIAKFEE